MDQPEDDEFFEDRHPDARLKTVAGFEDLNGIGQWQSGCLIQIKESGQDTVLLPAVGKELVQRLSVIEPLQVAGSFELDLSFGHDLPVDGMAFPISVFDRELFKDPGVRERVRFFYGPCPGPVWSRNKKICCHNDGETG